ncbi:MAG: hypothetical protein WA211_09180 [Candidatus Acidiferrales bacterium]
MSPQTSRHWKRFGPIPGLNPVRERRYALEVCIEVCGFNLLGRFFAERSETSNVSEGGCRFCLRTEIARDAILALRVVHRNNHGVQEAAPVLFQVVRVERSSNQWIVGALKLQSEELWPARLLPESHDASCKPA